MSGIGRVQGLLALNEEACRHAGMHRGRCHEADPAVVVLGVVPGKEGLRPGSGIDQTAKAVRVIGLILHRFELGLRERVVIRDMRPRMAGLHAEIGHE